MNLKKKAVPDKILILGAGVYGRPFTDHGKVVLCNRYELPDEYNWKEIKLVVFTGGNDVDPTMYKDYRHPKTNSNVQRDHMEKEYFDTALKNKVPMVGICRGSQFLTVMNKGSLVQHVTGHGLVGTHSIKTKEGKQVEVTSTHHQMMFPKGDDYTVLAWAEGLSKQYELGSTVAHPKTGDTSTKEPEVVWYNKTNSLAVQYHPEYMETDSGGYKYFQELLKEYVL